MHDERGEVGKACVEDEVGGGAGDPCQVQLASHIQDQLTACFVPFLPPLREGKRTKRQTSAEYLFKWASQRQKKIVSNYLK